MNEKEIRKLPRVYLDTNKWIELARTLKGKNSDTSSKKTCSKLFELSDTGKILIPFSSFNFYEIVKRNNPQQRDEMIDFMVDVSKGWFFKPVSRYFKYEVKNACYKKLGQNKQYDIFFNIITNRADSVLTGDTGKVTTRDDHNPTKEEAMKIKEVQKSWDGQMTDPVCMKKMFKLEAPRIFTRTDMMFIDQITKGIEFDRNNNFGVSNSMFNDYLLAKHIVAYLDRLVPEFLYNEKVRSQKLFSTRHEIETLLGNMPALNVCIELNHVRDKESKERPVDRNDYYDILHHATGVPYADVMIGEKMFGSIIKRQKLDKKNHCFLCTSFSELDNNPFIVNL